MAKTQIATTDGLRKQAYIEKLYRDMDKERYFLKFESENGSSIVHVKNELTRGQGDKVNFGIKMRLTGTGVTDRQTLEGNEESLVTHTNSLQLTQYRHAVRDQGKLDRKRPAWMMDEEARDSIVRWGAEKKDQLHFDALFSSPTTLFTPLNTATKYTAKATAAAALTSATVITPSFISWMRVWAKTGGNRAQTPLMPVRIEGKEYFVLLIHPDAMYDIKNDSTFAQARREAEVRGPSNPIFTGSTAIWDGVVIHEHENCTLSTTGGAGGDVNYCEGAFMGAQALLLANGMRGEVIAEEFDYKNEHGYAFDMMMKAGKPVFNSKDFGSIGVLVTRTKISDS